MNILVSISSAPRGVEGGGYGAGPSSASSAQQRDHTLSPWACQRGPSRRRVTYGLDVAVGEQQHVVAEAEPLLPRLHNEGVVHQHARHGVDPLGAELSRLLREPRQVLLGALGVKAPGTAASTAFFPTVSSRRQRAWP